MSMYTFKKDKYSKARNSYSRLLTISCRKCNNHLLMYQKDGQGNLRRLYFDRIFDPKELTKLEQKKISSIPLLRCKKCKEVLGVPYVYPSEHRKAFKLFQDAVVKKVRCLQ